MYGIISTQMLWSLREARKLQCRGSHHYKYDRDGKGSQMKLFANDGNSNAQVLISRFGFRDKLH